VAVVLIRELAPVEIGDKITTNTILNKMAMGIIAGPVF
jgi:hypothetical protein